MRNRPVLRYGSGDRLNKSSAPFAKPAKRCPSTGSGQSALMVGSARREAWWCVRWVRGFRQEVKNGIDSKGCPTRRDQAGDGFPAFSDFFLRQTNVCQYLTVKTDGQISKRPYPYRIPFEDPGTA
jgi:hypothetical protein